MSWEASSMQSKRSFFSRTLFRKNLARFWPLWGGASLAGSLLPLYMLLALLSGTGHGMNARDFSYALYAVAAMAGPALSLGYALLCAMLVWSYLYHPRSVGLMHTLPVDRTCLFVTSALSGLVMMLIPYAVVGGLTCLIAMCWGFFDLIAAVNTILAVLLMTLAFFGVATFCAMLTGSVFALPVLYLLLNFLAPLLEALLTSLAGAFLTGSPGGEGMFNCLSPVLQLYSKLSVDELRGAGGMVEDYVLRGFATLALYGLMGAVMLVLAWALYRRRHSECAGDIAAFRILRPIFRYGLALLSALVLGRTVYELLWGALFQRGMYAQFAPLVVCMALTGLLGYYAASMLLEKSLRVFRGSWRGAAVVCLGLAALCTALRMDLFGVERRVPDLEDVEWVQLRNYGDVMTYDTDTEPELAERLWDIHRTIVADREYLRSEAGHENNYYYYVFTYKLKNGGLFQRSYHLWITEERCADPDTYDGKLTALFMDPEVTFSRIAIPEGGTLTDVMIFDHWSDYAVDGVGEENARRLYEAILQDAREGNVSGRDARGYSTSSYEFSFEIEYRVLDEQGVYSHGYYTVWLYPSMEHTIAALLELEYLNQAELDRMDRALLEDEGEIVAP